MGEEGTLEVIAVERTIVYTTEPVVETTPLTFPQPVPKQINYLRQKNNITFDDDCSCDSSECIFGMIGLFICLFCCCCGIIILAIVISFLCSLFG